MFEFNFHHNYVVLWSVFENDFDLKFYFKRKMFFFNITAPNPTTTSINCGTVQKFASFKWIRTFKILWNWWFIWQPGKRTNLYKVEIFVHEWMNCFRNWSGFEFLKSHTWRQFHIWSLVSNFPFESVVIGWRNPISCCLFVSHEAERSCWKCFWNLEKCVVMMKLTNDLSFEKFRNHFL